MRARRAPWLDDRRTELHLPPIPLVSRTRGSGLQALPRKRANQHAVCTTGTKEEAAAVEVEYNRTIRARRFDPRSPDLPGAGARARHLLSYRSIREGHRRIERVAAPVAEYSHRPLQKGSPLAPGAVDPDTGDNPDGRKDNEFDRNGRDHPRHNVEIHDCGRRGDQPYQGNAKR